MKSAKLDWKLAIVCPVAALVLSGCYTRYPSIIEDISKDKILIKDAEDGKQRILVFPATSKIAAAHIKKSLKYSQAGDTILVRQHKYFGLYEDKKYVDVRDMDVYFNENLLYDRQQQYVFDSLRSEMIEEKQALQR